MARKKNLPAVESSKAHDLIRNAEPDTYEQLRLEDPEHFERMREGWSWIEHQRGPYDGHRTYFVGSPKWVVVFVDPASSPAKHKEGDPVHWYELEPGEDGYAVYGYKGVHRSKENADA